jgi:5-methylcytosine-specific restriction endonuclease McrA
VRHSILVPIPELDLAAKLLDASASAMLAGRFSLAASLLVQADLPEIMKYVQRAVGPLSVEVHKITKRPKCLPHCERHPTRMPDVAAQRTIFKRDGWRCRFCGTKVICKAARAVLTNAFVIEARWTGKEYQKHPALYALASSLDHVVPHGRGGENEDSNFVTACYCCQFGRGEWTLEESELYDPRLREPIHDGWDGLSRLVAYSTQLHLGSDVLCRRP